METRKITHDDFDNDIYEWTLRMEVGKWHTIKNIKMDRNKFINCIVYLIAIGENLVFRDDMMAFRKIRSFKEDLEISKQKSSEFKNRIRATNKPRGDTLFAKARKLQQEHTKSLKSKQIKPSPFSNRIK